MWSKASDGHFEHPIQRCEFGMWLVPGATIDHTEPRSYLFVFGNPPFDRSVSSTKNTKTFLATSSLPQAAQMVQGAIDEGPLSF